MSKERREQGPLTNVHCYWGLESQPIKISRERGKDVTRPLDEISVDVREECVLFLLEEGFDLHRQAQVRIEVAKKIAKSYSVKTFVRCEHCGGTGRENKAIYACTKCDGRGKVEDEVERFPEFASLTIFEKP
jgi:hypothetical protein